MRSDVVILVIPFQLDKIHIVTHSLIDHSADKPISAKYLALFQVQRSVAVFTVFYGFYH